MNFGLEPNITAFYHIRDLRRIRNTIDRIILQPLILLLLSPNSKLDNCSYSALLLNLPSTRTKRLQLVLTAAARAVTKTPKFHHISPILQSLHWLKIDEIIQYKILCLTYKTLHSGHDPSSFISHFSPERDSSTR
jgi:hypothetical protein